MNLLPFISVLIGAILWGTTGTAQSYLPESVHPLTVGALRLAGGGLILLFFAIAMRRVNFGEWPWRATLVAAVAMALFQPFFFGSVRLTGVAVGTVTGIGSAPVFAGLIEWIILRRRPSRRWVMATVLAVAGCALLLLTGDDVSVNPSGVLLALGAGLTFAVYSMTSKIVLEFANPAAAVGVVFTISALLLSPFLFIYPLDGLRSQEGISVIVYIAVAATAVAYLLYSSGLKELPAATAVTLALAEPLTAAILGVAIVGEELNFFAWMGVGLLLAGLIVLTFGKRGTDEERTPYFRKQIREEKE
ncbi:drug/metabolite transporter, DME family [Bhargavaea ginsengi]|uniref:Drug/metabolite transporter, DME family n=1 Tax=Bhargavaea ginsengi TaxID=426757 RepID=A0A1H6VC36_9BACL|nr:DMT family transporter [Bhargavaea ginsengi]SEI97842.1 drug/metabolite transporter, DME family [Bhargavaea ginsengi]